MSNLIAYQKHLQTKSPREIIEWAHKEFGLNRVALATSFGVEDQVLTHMSAEIDRRARIFTLDTGRVFQETYDTMHNTIVTYGIDIETYAPEAQDVAALNAAKGPNLFYNSVEDRKLCCTLRKLRPLAKVLGTVDAWITGLRAEQSITRYQTSVIEWDEQHQIYKINPLYNWSEKETWAYVEEFNVPYNRLHDQGFPSIGCQPCTRAVEPGADVRAGRWWWEAPESKECGLHRKSA